MKHHMPNAAPQHTNDERMYFSCSPDHVPRRAAAAVDAADVGEHMSHAATKVEVGLPPAAAAASFVPQSNAAVEAVHGSRGALGWAQMKAGQTRGRPADRVVAQFDGSAMHRPGAATVTPEMQARIARGWRRFAVPGCTFQDVYRRTMVDEFHTFVRSGVHGEDEIVARQPFPSYRQFRYWVDRLFSPEIARGALKGRRGPRG